MSSDSMLNLQLEICREPSDAALELLKGASGQHTLSNTSAKQSHLTGTLQHLQSASAQQLTPSDTLGKLVTEKLQVC